MTSKQVDYCIELAHTLNFSRAAENLFVSQPTFSYQIRLLEEEVGFPIFERSGRGASLTPAGADFVVSLANIREELKRAVERGQNFSARYRDSISISLMVRQAVYFLPEAMRLFASEFESVQITPMFQYENGVEAFLRGDADVLFALREQTRHIPGITVKALFDSRVYLIAQPDDPLAAKDLIRAESERVEYFNSPDHDTTLTNVAAGRGVCLAPGFLNDHSGQFAWIPFDCPERFECVLCTHKNDVRESLKRFVEILQGLYKEAVAFPM